jgi:hypothetical protein
MTLLLSSNSTCMCIFKLVGPEISTVTDTKYIEKDPQTNKKRSVSREYAHLHKNKCIPAARRCLL